MAKEYETFVRDRAHVLSGREVVLALRELVPGRKRYRGLNVRAIVSQPPRAGEPILWMRSVVGVKDQNPCSLKIVEQLPDVLDAPPYSDLFKALEAAERK
jgi:hypothetical protein